MHSIPRKMKIILMWILVFVYSAIVYLTLPYGPLIREKIYKSFPPKILETYPLSHESLQIKEKWKVLFSADGEHGLGIYDISKTDTLNEIARVPADDMVTGYYESRYIFYLVDKQAGIHIVDLHESSAPVSMSRFQPGAIANDVIVRDQYMLVAADTAGLVIADVSEKSDPIIAAAFPLPGSALKLTMSGDVAIVGTDSSQLHFIDIADKHSPQLLATVELPAAVTSILDYQNHVYVACRNAGIQIIDISDVQSPRKMGFLKNDHLIPQMRFRNGYIMAANMENGLLIVNVTNPRNPKIQRVFNTGKPATYVYTRFYYAYLSDTTPAAYYMDIDAGRNSVVYFVAIVLALALVWIIVYLIRTRKAHRWYNYLALILISVIYGHYLNEMLILPIEAIHFLQYGLLGILVFLALKNHVNNYLIYFVGAALITIIGTGDEFFQWILPNRSWDFRDVGFNALSGGLVQLAIWFGISPQSIHSKINHGSIRLLRRYLIGTALLFAILLSLTPQINTWLANRVSFLIFLDNPAPITEYGYKVFHPDIGGFFSRFKEKDLLAYDKNHADEVANILNSHYRTNYGKFLRMYTPGNAPFVHEMRVHIFRRDRYFQDRRLLVAYKENLILKNFFGHSLNKSLYKWSGDEMQQSRDALGDKVNEFYVSPVSHNVITSFGMRTVWVVFFVFVGVVVLGEVLVRRKVRE